MRAEPVGRQHRPEVRRIRVRVPLGGLRPLLGGFGVPSGAAWWSALGGLGVLLGGFRLLLGAFGGFRLLAGALGGLGAFGGFCLLVGAFGVSFGFGWLVWGVGGFPVVVGLATGVAFGGLRLLLSALSVPLGVLRLLLSAFSVPLGVLRLLLSAFSVQVRGVDEVLGVVGLDTGAASGRFRLPLMALGIERVLLSVLQVGRHLVSRIDGGLGGALRVVRCLAGVVRGVPGRGGLLLCLFGVLPCGIGGPVQRVRFVEDGVEFGLETVDVVGSDARPLPCLRCTLAALLGGVGARARLAAEVGGSGCAVGDVPFESGDAGVLIGGCVRGGHRSRCGRGLIGFRTEFGQLSLQRERVVIDLIGAEVQ